MKKVLLLLFVIFCSIAASAQLEVKQGSFKEVPGFVNINTDKMYDDNDKPYAVLKVRTENIDNKQRRELKFGGDAQTFFEIEYKDGEVWLYISYYATFLKVSHPDLSSTEFWFPFDMQPKKGYEMTLINKPSVDEEILKRLEKLENATATVAVEQTLEKPIEKVGYITVKTNPKGAWVLIDNKIVGTTPYLSEAIEVGNHKISVDLDGYEPMAKRVVIENEKEIAIEFVLDKEVVAEETVNGLNEIKQNHALNSEKIDIINGVFSVSSNNKVYFSKGNLYYNESANIWSFAENQWDKANDELMDLFEWSNNETMNLDGVSFRLLTIDEWDYVFNKRKTDSGIRYAKAIVNGMKGIILLPDNWNELNFELINTNIIGGLFSYNRISANDWISIFEANGAVFLPASGHCKDTSVVFVGSEGNYWSSTSYNDDRAYLVNFDDAYISTKFTDYKKNGVSIRLVCDAE